MLPMMVDGLYSEKTLRLIPVWRGCHISQTRVLAMYANNGHMGCPVSTRGSVDQCRYQNIHEYTFTYNVIGDCSPFHEEDGTRNPELMYDPTPVFISTTTWMS